MSVFKWIWSGLTNTRSPAFLRWVLIAGFTLASAIGALLGVQAVLHGESEQAADLLLEILIFIIVALFAVAMVFSLMKARQRIHPVYRGLAFAFYLLTVAWSVSFGFAFWWGILSAQAETYENYETALQQYRERLGTNRGAYDAKLEAVTALSTTAMARMQQERDRGGSCAVPSPRGGGPLFQARERLNQDISSVLASVTRRVGELQGEVKAEDKLALDRLESLRTADKQKRIDDLQTWNNDYTSRIPTLNSTFSTAMKTSATSLRSLAKTMDVPPDPTGRLCSDKAFAEELRNKANDIEEWIDIEPPLVESLEGNASTLTALVRYGDMVWKAATLQKGALDGMSNRDWYALAVAAIVDIGLFIFAMVVPPPPLSGAMGGEMSHEAVRNKIRERYNQNRAGFSDFLGLRFDAGGRYYFGLPSTGWADSSQGADGAGKSNRRRRVKDIQLFFDSANLLRRVYVLSRKLWPWRPVYDRAIDTLLEAQWRPDESASAAARLKEKARTAQTLEPAYPDIEIVRIEKSDLNEVTSVTTGLESVATGSHSAVSEALGTNSGFDLPPRAERLMAEVNELDLKIYGMGDRRNLDENHKSELFRLERQQALRINELDAMDFSTTGWVNDNYNSEQHVESDQRVADEQTPRGKIYRVIQHGFIDERKRRGKNARRIILRAQVVVSEGPERRSMFRRDKAEPAQRDTFRGAPEEGGPANPHIGNGDDREQRPPGPAATPHERNGQAGVDDKPRADSPAQEEGRARGSQGSHSIFDEDGNNE